MLDVGYKEATVVPVYEGVPVLASWQAQPLAGEAVEEAVKTDLITRGVITSGVVGDTAERAGDRADCLTEDLIRDITVKCCFVTNINRGGDIRKAQEKLNSSEAPSSPTTLLSHLAPLVNYPISGSRYLQVRFGNMKIKSIDDKIARISCKDYI